MKTMLCYLLALVLLGSSTALPTNKYVDSRDGNEYRVIRLGDLYWMQENLRYRVDGGSDTLISIGNCGVFYNHHAAATACPEGWRLPTEDDLKRLLKEDKKGKINLADTLQIELCGRIDYEKHSKPGIQNTFWLDEELEDGHVLHWHTFGHENELHTHNVIQARRMFPVRCVCEDEF